jgi:hypothetical protein
MLRTDNFLLGDSGNETPLFQTLVIQPLLALRSTQKYFVFSTIETWPTL